MIAAPALKKVTLQTVFANNSNKYYTKIDNKTIRLKIPGDRLNAKDILLDALSCEKGWLMTTFSLAKRHGVSIKVMGNLLTILAKAGHARSITITDPVSKRIVRRQWIFFETPRTEPQPQNGGYGSGDEKPRQSCKNTPKSLNPQNGAKALYIDQDIKNKRQLEKTTTTPPPESPPDHQTPKAPGGPVADIQKVRKMLPPQLSMRLNNQAIAKLIVKDPAHIAWASQEAIKSRASNKAGLFINLMKGDKPPMCEQTNRLKPVPLPADIDGNSDQMRAIACYNRNVTGQGCSTMRGTELPSTNCKLYCPYLAKK